MCVRTVAAWPAGQRCPSGPVKQAGSSERGGAPVVPHPASPCVCSSTEMPSYHTLAELHANTINVLRHTHKIHRVKCVVGFRPETKVKINGNQNIPFFYIESLASETILIKQNGCACSSSLMVIGIDNAWVRAHL